MEILIATFLGLIVGLSGTLCGGIGVLTGSKRLDLAQQGGLLGFSGGIMVVVVIFDLWPEAVHYGGFWITIWGTLLGMSLIWYSDKLLHWIPGYSHKQHSPFIRIGLLLGLGIGVHNFPEGVALGTVYAADSSLSNWLGLALLMAIHNIPEGMVVAAALRLGKASLFSIIFTLFAVEIPMALGGTVGAFLGMISPRMLAASLGFAGGAMFLLVIKELIPMAKKISGYFQVGIGLSIGIGLGIILIKLIM